MGFYFDKDKKKVYETKIKGLAYEKTNMTKKERLKDILNETGKALKEASMQILRPQRKIIKNDYNNIDTELDLKMKQAERKAYLKQAIKESKKLGRQKAKLKFNPELNSFENKKPKTNKNEDILNALMRL